MNILIVDDDPDIRYILKEIVRMHGHEPSEASDGIEALRIARKHKPDIIISDSLMPRMDGFQLLRETKSDKNLRQIPFVFYSASYTGTDEVDLALSSGAAGYIIKPKSPDEFWEEFDSILKKSKKPGTTTAKSRKKSEEYLERYSHIVSAKLEEKVRELESTLIEKQKAEKALIDSEQRFKKLVESVTDYIYSVEIRDGQFASASHGPGCVAVTGYTSQEYEADPYLWYRMIYDEDRDVVTRQNEAILSGKAAPPLEHRIVHKNGSVRWVRNTPVFRHDEQGQTVGYDGLITDITERNQSEEALKESEKKFRTLFEAATDAIFILDLKGNFIDLNATAYERLGYTREEMLTKHITELDPPEFAAKVPERLEQITKYGKAVFESAHIRKNGTVMPVEINSQIIDFEGGKAFFSIIRDITERKKAEYTLRASEARYRNLIETSPAVIYSLSTENGIITSLNPAFERITGWSCDEWINRPFAPIIHPDDLPIALGVYQRIMNRETPLPYELRILSKSGKYLVGEFTSAPQIESGKVVGEFGIVSDITERKKAEEKLAETTQTIQSLINASPLAIIVVDPEGHVLIWNRSAENIFGWSEQETLGQFNPIIPREQLEEFRAFLERVLKGESFNNIETRRQKKDGALINVSLSTAPLRDAKGTVIGILGILADITDRKKMEEKIFQISQDWEETFNSITDMVTVHDKDWNIIRANTAAEKILGLPFMEMTSDKKCFQYYHGTEKPPEGCPSCDCLKTGISALFEIFEPHLNMFIEIRAIPRFDSNNNLIGLIHVVRDITERKKTEEYIQRQMDRMAALRSIDMAISSTLDLRVTLHILLEQVVTQLKADAADILLLDPHTMHLNFAAGRGFRTKAVEKTHIRLGQGFAGKAAMEQKTISMPDLAEGGELLTSALKDEGFRAYFAVPLIAKGHLKGTLEIFTRSPLAPDSDWLSFLEMLGGQAAIAVDNVSMFDTLQRSHAELVMAYDTTIEGWAKALDFRDKETEGHSRRVTDLTVDIAHAMGIHEDELVHVRRGALLHDIGKLGVPDNILLKPGKLTDEEWITMKKHPGIAFEILAPIHFLRAALDIPYCHHEKWDGTGYPRGLKGEQIPLPARIFAIVDVWDALRSDRPYRPAWPEEKAFEHIRSLSGSHFDPQVVDAFHKIIKER